MSYDWCFTAVRSVRTQKDPLRDSDLLVLTVRRYGRKMSNKRGKGEKKNKSLGFSLRLSAKREVTRGCALATPGLNVLHIVERSPGINCYKNVSYLNIFNFLLNIHSYKKLLFQKIQGLFDSFSLKKPVELNVPHETHNCIVSQIGLLLAPIKSKV